MARHYDTPCTLRFRARSAGAAVELCKAAADHLEETFNDDGSYLGLIVGPTAPDPAREALSAVQHLAGYGQERAQAAACYRDELVTLHAAALALVRKLQGMPGIHPSHYAELAGLLGVA